MKITIKKQVIYILAVVVFILIGIFTYLLLTKKNYIKEEMTISTLGYTKEEIDISEVGEESESDIKQYSVYPRVHTDLVEKLISNLDLSLTKTEIVKDVKYEWKDSKNYFSYDSLTDTVSFVLNEGITISNEKLFNTFYSKYLNLDYEFSTVKESKDSESNITYFSSRVLDSKNVELGLNEEYSDILKIDKNGKLISGKLLLAEFSDTTYIIPIITDYYLKQYINNESYPKEVYVNTSVLYSTLQLDYLDSAWQEIESTVDKCKGNSRSLIYLYKNSDQQYLTPTYKYSSTCTVKYKETEYSVPAIFYVNAIDPEYVSQ